MPWYLNARRVRAVLSRPLVVPAQGLSCCSVALLVWYGQGVAMLLFIFFGLPVDTILCVSVSVLEAYCCLIFNHPR